MKKEKKLKYYHKGDFEYIQKLVRKNRLEAAVAEYEKYLEKYPNDYCSHALYADSLVKLGRFEEAEKVLDSVVIDSKTPIASKQTLTLIRIKLLSCLEQYEKCLELVKENLDMFEQRNWDLPELLIFLKKKLNLLADIDYSGYSYKIDQITSYSEQAAIECIKTCHTIGVSNPPFCFNQDFPLEEVYYKIREMLPLENKIYRNIINNSYIFKYDNNGVVNGKKVDYIEVITFQGSNDIVTMYPYENNERMFYVDITPEMVEDKPKVKRMSQIDKFNQRYNR